MEILKERPHRGDNGRGRSACWRRSRGRCVASSEHDYLVGLDGRRRQLVHAASPRAIHDVAVGHAARLHTGPSQENLSTRHDRRQRHGWRAVKRAWRAGDGDHRGRQGNRVLTMQRIYLDYNASTPRSTPAVVAAMRPSLRISTVIPRAGIAHQPPARAASRRQRQGSIGVLALSSR